MHTHDTVIYVHMVCGTVWLFFNRVRCACVDPRGVLVHVRRKFYGEGWAARIILDQKRSQIPQILKSVSEFFDGKEQRSSKRILRLCVIHGFILSEGR